MKLGLVYYSHQLLQEGPYNKKNCLPRCLLTILSRVNISQISVPVNLITVTNQTLFCLINNLRNKDITTKLLHGQAVDKSYFFKEWINFNWMSWCHGVDNVKSPVLVLKFLALVGKPCPWIYILKNVHINSCLILHQNYSILSNCPCMTSKISKKVSMRYIEGCFFARYYYNTRKRY